MTVELPGEPALALIIAARSEPAPELLRLVTTTDRLAAGAADVKADGPATWAEAAAATTPAEIATAVDVQLAMQPIAMTRKRFVGRKRPIAGSQRCRNRDPVTLLAVANKVRRITTTPALLGYTLRRKILGRLAVCAVTQSECHDTPNRTLRLSDKRFG